MPSLVDLLERMTPEQLGGALTALDAVSRPLSAREIERALRDQWVSKSQATKLACALHRFNIIAVVGPEAGHSNRTADRPETAAEGRNSLALPRFVPRACSASTGET